MPSSYPIAGREVGMPVVVRDAASATASYVVNTDAARALLPGPEIELAEVAPGRALFSLGAIQYRDNDLGDYNEVSLAFFVRRRGAPRGIPYLGTFLDVFRSKLGTFIYRLPVNQMFTCEAGRGIWGFPKTVDEIEVQNQADSSQCEWSCEGQPVLRFRCHRGGSRQIPDTSMATYTYIEGIAHQTQFTTGATGVGIKLGGAELELGSHPIADVLRSLGLPKRPLFSMWMEHMHGRFDSPEKL